MNDDQKQKAIYLMQIVCLSNYCKLCIKLEKIPELSVVNNINNCEIISDLNEINKIILRELN
jgi:hypothetical protein